MENEEQLTLLARSADQSKDVTMGGIEFEHSNQDEFEKQVKLMALQNAMAAVDAYASKLKLKLQPGSFVDVAFQVTAP